MSIKQIRNIYWQTSEHVASPYQIHVISPVEILLHCSVIQTNPSVLMAHTCPKQEKTHTNSTDF